MFFTLNTAVCCFGRFLSPPLPAPCRPERGGGDHGHVGRHGDERHVRCPQEGGSPVRRGRRALGHGGVRTGRRAVGNGLGERARHAAADLRLLREFYRSIFRFFGGVLLLLSVLPRWCFFSFCGVAPRLLLLVFSCSGPCRRCVAILPFILILVNTTPYIL